MKVRPELFHEIDKKFRDHIEIDENFRIVFSGKFGIGKTTFLKHFFNSKDSEIINITLYPVNYSILDNEDIFSYIKYDILTNLLSNYELKERHLAFLNSWDNFMTSNLSQVVATAMLLIPKLGKQLNLLIKEIVKLDKEFAKHKKSQLDKDKEEIHSYLDQFHKAEGGIYEANVITLIIQEWILDLKESGKKVILVMEDLDRIDPNHIFRILNIFSAHFDTTEGSRIKNKFGFNQVMLVCDINNIKRIFHAQYGAKVDFNGYVDKFYSKEIFRFDNTENILSIIKEIVEGITINYEQEGKLLNHPEQTKIHQRILTLLEPIINYEKINLRSLFKYTGSSIIIREHRYYVGDTYIHEFNNITLSALRVLQSIIGDRENLIEIIHDTESFIISKENRPDLVVGDCILFLSNLNQNTRCLDHLRGRCSEDQKFNLSTKLDRHFHGNFIICGPQKEYDIAYMGILQTLHIESETVYERSNPIKPVELKPFIDKLILELK